MIVDHIQYERHDWQNRNRIRNKQGEVWLRIPIKKTGRETPINQVMVDNNQDWKKNHWETIKQCYQKAKFWDPYYEFFEQLYQQDFNYLVDINLKIIGYLTAVFGIRTPIEKSSYYGFKKQKTELLIEMTKKFNCTGYLSGRGATDYVDEKRFKDEKLTHQFVEFKHPKYNQMWKPFMHNLSAIDLLFNEGPNAKKILFGGENNNAR